MSLEYTLLGLLNRKARTGYELSKIVSKTTNFYWTATSTQVYQSLKKMAAKEWVSVETIWQTSKPSKQVYHIQQEGKKAFEAWLHNPPDSTTLKVPFMIQMYFLDLLGKEEILKKISLVEKEHQDLLKKYNDFKQNIIDPEKTDQENQARYLPLLAGIFTEEAWLKWCETARQEIEKLPD